MELDPRICYRALRTRDARFDGRFFTGVVSTGIYCRPVCPAPAPKLENCRFYACAAAAQEAGFRPCLRCRPEASPGTPAWLGTSGTVSRALRLISEGALDADRVDDLAERLGVGDRHLRRLFVKHLGTSPVAVAQTQRILFAKKLIDETDLPLAEVALAAGFASVRRFNDAVRGTYKRTPTELRRAHRGRRNGKTAHRVRVDANGSAGGELVLELPFRPPYAWGELVRFLAARAIPGVESVGEDHYRRTVCIDGHHGQVEVRPASGRSHLVARLRLADTSSLIQVVGRLRRIFDLGADPEPIARHLSADRRLAPAIATWPGLRVPGAWDGFELAVRAILGQQVTVRAATTLAGRIAARFGEPLRGDVPEIDSSSRELRFVFPCPEVLADADLAGIGLTKTRAAAIRALAKSVAEGDVSFDAAVSLDMTIDRLRALPGVGEWTAQYVAMRALREPDAFPAGDLALRRELGLSARELARAAEAWRPWRAYATLYVWTWGGSRGTAAA